MYLTRYICILSVYMFYVLCFYALCCPCGVINDNNNNNNNNISRAEVDFFTCGSRYIYAAIADYTEFVINIT